MKVTHEVRDFAAAQSVRAIGAAAAQAAAIGDAPAVTLRTPLGKPWVPIYDAEAE